MTTVQEMDERLNSDYYKNKKPYPGIYEHKMVSMKSDEGRQMIEAYNEEENRITTEFQKDAIEAVGLKGHPRADKAYSLAWSNGHACGFREVFSHLVDIADVLIGD